MKESLPEVESVTVRVPVLVSALQPRATGRYRMIQDDTGRLSSLSLSLIFRSLRMRSAQRYQNTIASTQASKQGAKHASEQASEQARERVSKRVSKRLEQTGTEQLSAARG